MFLQGHVTNENHYVSTTNQIWQEFQMEGEIEKLWTFFPNCILIINSYTGLVSVGSSHIKDTFSKRNKH